MEEETNKTTEAQTKIEEKMKEMKVVLMEVEMIKIETSKDKALLLPVEAKIQETINMIVVELMELLLLLEEVTEEIMTTKAQIKIEMTEVVTKVPTSPLNQLVWEALERNQIRRVTNLMNTEWSLKLINLPQFIETRESNKRRALVINSLIAMRLPWVKIPERTETL